MMTITQCRSLGGDDGPVSPSIYKRAVIRPAPREFTVEVLCPTKQGNHFSYGVRVCPVVRSRGSSDSRSSSGDAEYDIWRRWEDCLDFQETLENEYSKLSRQKVKILKRWASGKKRPEEMDSPYCSRNAAASFESLPEGPDPRDVAIDVHKIVPALSRKGTLFRVGRTTLKQRGDEFAAMIQALFNPSPDAPVLLQELRNSSSIRDFFAFWRRDKDLLKRAGKDVPRLRKSNLSMSSLSDFSFKSFSTAPESPAVPVFPTATSPAAFLRHSMFSRTVTDLHTEDLLSNPSSAPPATRRFVPNAMPSLSQSSLLHSHPPKAATGGFSGSMMFTDELLLDDEPTAMVQSVLQHRVSSHNLMPQSSRHFVAREIQPRTSHLSSTRVPYQIPEVELNSLPRPQARPRRNSSTAPGHRNARIFIPAPTSELGIAEQSPHYSPVDQRPNSRPSSPPQQRTLHSAFVSPGSPKSLSHSRSVSSIPSSISMNRFSITSSVSSYTQASLRSSSHGSEFSDDSESCFDLDMTLPNSPVIPHTSLSEIAEAHDFEPERRSRASASSLASIRTEASADGVLPRHLHPHANSPCIRGSTLPLDAQTQSPIEPIPEGEDLLDAYYLADGARFSMVNLNKELPPIFAHKGKHSISSISSEGSVNSIDSGSHFQAPSSPRNDGVVVKAACNESVIVFRAERTMCLIAVRRRIMERFALHEGIPLDEDFLLGYFPFRTTPNGVGGRGRSNSVNSTVSDLSHLQMLQTEADWQAAIVTSNGKLTLRVLVPGPLL